MITIKILLSLSLLVFLYIVFYLIRGIRNRQHPTPDDLLYDLNFKIENSGINDTNELYLIGQIKQLRMRKDIDKERLSILDIKFRQRFSILHQN